MKIILSHSLLYVSLTFIFSGCLESPAIVLTAKEQLNKDLKSLISEHNLTGDPSTGKNIPSINSNKAQLGMKLFFSKALGGDKDSACVTCHHPSLGGGDNLSLSIGVAADMPNLLGENRTHSSNAVNYDQGYAPVPRNAPTTFNIALWEKALFWDGRVEKVAGGIRTPDSNFSVADPNAGANLAVAQARFPITSPEEMRGFVFEAGNSTSDLRSHLANRLSDSNAADYIQNTWQDEFDDVYGANSITMANIVDAIGEYENSQLLVDNPWKKYVQGNNDAISDDAKEGAKLFFNSYENNGVNCVQCHTGDFFTDENYYVMAIPQVGHGKGDGNTSDNDFGRFREDSNASKFAFRTPSLLNVEVTGPWGHSGAYTTLEGIISHMVNTDSAINAYDTSLLQSMVKVDNVQVNTNAAKDQLIQNRANQISPHVNQTLSSSEINKLVEFIKTLTDPCVKDRTCMGKWVPENNATNPDSLRLDALTNL